MLSLPRWVGIVIHVIFAAPLFVLEEILIARELYLVTTKINEIKEQWADTDRSGEYFLHKLFLDAENKLYTIFMFFYMKTAKKNLNNCVKRFSI